MPHGRDQQWYHQGIAVLLARPFTTRTAYCRVNRSTAGIDDLPVAKKLKGLDHSLCCHLGPSISVIKPYVRHQALERICRVWYVDGLSTSKFNLFCAECALKLGKAVLPELGHGLPIGLAKAFAHQAIIVRQANYGSRVARTFGYCQERFSKTHPSLLNVHRYCNPAPQRIRLWQSLKFVGIVGKHDYQ